MPAFAVAEIFEVTDREKLAAYGKRAADTVGKHGGRLVAAATGEAVEGEWPHDLLVLVQFDDMAALRSWYFSPEYQAIIPMRQEAARGRLALLDGN